MSVRQTSAGAEGMLSSEGKIGVIPQLGLAFVHSGHGEQPLVKPCGDFEANARAVHAAYAAIPRPVLASRVLGADGGEPERKQLDRIGTQEVIAASIFSGRMVFMDLDSERWADTSGLFIAGAPTIWAREQGLNRLPVPDTLEGAAQLAVQIASDFIAHHYGGRTLADFVTDGIIPPVAYPLHLIEINGHAVIRKEIR